MNSDVMNAGARVEGLGGVDVRTPSAEWCSRYQNAGKLRPVVALAPLSWRDSRHAATARQIGVGYR
jgi:hypothetical protein